ncbi:MAG: hypothetical protein L3J91_01480, partial [Thermoplasmata archaeon]|nr:hypothetical protein [Thermoplasmata archaeon]
MRDLVDAPYRRRALRRTRVIVAAAVVAVLLLVVVPAGPLRAPSERSLPVAPPLGDRGNAVPALSPVSPTMRFTPDAPGPAAGYTVSSTGASPTALALSWSAFSGIGFGSYVVQSSPNGSAGSWSTVAVVTSSTTTSFVDDQLGPGSTAWWQVTENGLVGSGTTNALGVGIAFGSYILYESINGGASGAVTTITAETTTNYTVQGLSSGSSYAFYVSTADCLSACSTGTPVNAWSQSNVVTFGTPLPLGSTISVQRSVVDTLQADLFTCTPSGGVSPFHFQWDSGNGTFVSGGSAESYS